jgi:hypothetical protein
MFYKSLCIAYCPLMKPQFVKHFFAVVIFLFSVSEVQGQISIQTSDNFEYVQDFNSLTLSTNDVAWTNNVTLPGWYAVREHTEEMLDVPSFFSLYRASSGSSTARLYSFGTNGDRALGAVNQDVESGHIVYGAWFQNNSAEEIHSITLSMKAEQWRRPLTNQKAHQRVKVCYAIANPVEITESWLLDSTQFVEIPEAYLITKDTTTMDASANLDGNLPQNFYNVSVTFPVSIPPGHQFFLRFFDENAKDTDAAMAVDDLSITFSNQNNATRISGNSDYSVFAYVDMGMNLDIPDVDGGHVYIVPSTSDMATWSEIFTKFNTELWSDVDALIAPYGYVLTQFTDASNARTYYVLRKENSSTYFWGTFVKAMNPINEKLVLTSPHPIDDQFTGRQCAAVFHLAGAENLIIAGMGRCVSPHTDPSPCIGQTGTCHMTEQDEPYRKSDVAHFTGTIFHLATTTLADQRPSTVFVQLHGFSQETGQLDEFYVSCGTLDAFQKSVPDYAVLVREHLKSTVPSWDLTVTHVDNNETLGARDNVQGRFLNAYTPFAELCTNTTEPVTVTNRFLHIEQYNAYRKAPTYYTMLANALAGAINDNEYVRQIRITDVDDFIYQQNFNTLPAAYTAGTIHTWGNNLHLPGWYAVRGVVGLFSNYTVGDGSSTAGGLYSFGNAAGDLDRAFGTLNTSATGKAAYGMLFRNDTGATIYSINLSYDAEQWRRTNGASQRVKLSYAVGASLDVTSNGLLNDILFTNVPSGDLISTDNSGNGSVNGNVVKTSITDVAIPIVFSAGQELFIRFLDEDEGGAGTNDNAMALDNLVVSFSETPLPVNWRYFEVEKSGKKALLRWAADAENKCDDYQIQRSTDGLQFENIVSVNCKKISGTNNYEFIDHPSGLGALVYYRIRQNDIDGMSTYSQVRVFKQNPNVAPAVSYQNGLLLLQANRDERMQFVSVFDSMGRLVAEGEPISEGNGQYQISCTLPRNQLMIVRIKGDRGSYASRMRTGD